MFFPFSFSLSLLLKVRSIYAWVYFVILYTLDSVVCRCIFVAFVFYQCVPSQKHCATLYQSFYLFYLNIKQLNFFRTMKIRLFRCSTKHCFVLYVMPHNVMHGKLWICSIYWDFVYVLFAWYCWKKIIRYCDKYILHRMYSTAHKIHNTWTPTHTHTFLSAVHKHTYSVDRIPFIYTSDDVRAR